MILVKINAEVDTATTKAMSVSGFPTLVLVDKDGTEIDRVVGFLPTDEFIGTLDDYQKDIGTLADLLRKADTTTDRTLFYEIADKYKYRSKPDEADIWFQRVIKEGHPTDSLSCESRLSLANMHLRAKNYDQALKMYEGVSMDLKTGMFAETADIWRAIVHRQKADTAAALAAFDDFMKKYPESEDIEYANRQIAKLKGETEQK